MSTATKTKGTKRPRSTKAKVKAENEPEPIPAPEVAAILTQPELPVPEPESEPEPELVAGEPFVSELELSDEPAAKKRKTIKTGNKARKTQIITKIASESEKLLHSIQEDLEKTKFETKAADRAARKYQKDLSKILGLVRRVNTESKPAVRSGKSGFEKPYNITAAVADFFGWDRDSTKSRIQVNGALCEYIKANDLQDPTNRRMIRPNAALKELFGREEDFNYAQMQGFISHLLVKP